MKLKKMLLALLILPLTSCGININNEENIVEKGEKMNIKLLSSGTDGNGHQTKTFGYTITPVDAYYIGVTPTITFADNRQDGSSYLTASVNPTSQECTITCLQAFDSIATLTLTANQEGATASVNIHYQRRRYTPDVQDATYTLSSVQTYRGTVTNDTNKSLYKMVRENISTPKDAVYTDDIADWTYSFSHAEAIRGGNWITSDYVYLGGKPSNTSMAASSSWGASGSYALSIMNDMTSAFSSLDLDQQGPYGDTQAVNNGSGGASTSIMYCINSLIYDWDENGGNTGQNKLVAFSKLLDNDGYFTLTFKVSGTIKLIEDGVVNKTFWLTYKIPDMWNLRNRSTINSITPEAGATTITF